MSTVSDALRDLVIANRILAHHNVLDAFGHVSIRHPEHPDTYFLARSKGPAGVTLDDLIEFTLDSEPINQNGRAMYAERQIHGKIYTARPDVQAVCHNHFRRNDSVRRDEDSDEADLPHGQRDRNDVPKWDIAREFGDTNLLVTTPEQGASLAKKLGKGRVVLMRGHGNRRCGEHATRSRLYVGLPAEECRTDRHGASVRRRAVLEQGRDQKSLGALVRAALPRSRMVCVVGCGQHQRSLSCGASPRAKPS